MSLLGIALPTGCPGNKANLRPAYLVKPKRKQVTAGGGVGGGGVGGGGVGGGGVRGAGVVTANHTIVTNLPELV